MSEQLPDDLKDWTVDITEGDGRVQVVMQLHERGQIVADVGGTASDEAGALAMAIEQARQWLAERD